VALDTPGNTEPDHLSDSGGQPTGEPTAREIAGLLASASRLKVVAALTLGATTAEEIAELSGLRPNHTRQALARLLRGRLVEGDETSGYLLRETAFADAARAGAVKQRTSAFDGLDPAMARVLRTYLVDGRLQSIPAAGRKRRAVLEYLACAFEPGQRYSEPQVNAILRAWHADVAALRRYLIDESLLAREASEYWRIGGWLDLDVS
jgi:hypothetical protein